MDWDKAMNTLMSIRADLETLQGIIEDNQTVLEANTELLDALEPFVKVGKIGQSAANGWSPRQHVNDYDRAVKVYNKHRPKPDNNNHVTQERTG